VQLNLKVKGLLAELDEIRSQREHAGFQADNVTRLQVKQLTEHSATIKALEVCCPVSYTYSIHNSYNLACNGQSTTS